MAPLPPSFDSRAPTIKFPFSSRIILFVERRIRLPNHQPTGGSGTLYPTGGSGGSVRVLQLLRLDCILAGYYCWWCV